VAWCLLSHRGRRQPGTLMVGSAATFGAGTGVWETMSRRAIFALGAALLAVVALIALPLLLPVDEAVYRWLQFHRPCGAYAIAAGIDRTLRATLGVLLLGALVAQRRRRLDLLIGPALLIASGAAFGELLKTAIERLRPSALPGMVSGNSLPSGHVMNTTLFAVVACLLVRQSRAPRWMRIVAYVLAGACVAAQAGTRVLRGSHWPSDVPVSVLLGVAWVLGAGLVWRSSRRAAPLGLAALAAAYAVFYAVPGLRVHLPSALDDPGSSVPVLALGPPAVQAAPLDGALIATRVGSHGVIRVLDDGTSLSIPYDDDGGGVLKMILRGPRDASPQTCIRLATSVNEWTAPAVTLLDGWREYHLAIPPGVLRAGANVVRFGTADGARPCPGPPTRHLGALATLRLTPDGTAAPRAQAGGARHRAARDDVSARRPTRVALALLLLARRGDARGGWSSP
jgi:membrane-associated phospholipid phosphatase